MLDLLTVGDIKLDTFVVIPNAHVSCRLRQPECQLCIAYGEKIPINTMHSQIAGSAPNVAIALAKMKKQTAIASIMGRDPLYAMARNFLTKHQVSTRYVKTRAEYKSSFAVVIDYQGESTQLVSHSSNGLRLPSPTPKTRWLHISESGEHYEGLYKDALIAAKKGACISFNPGTIQIQERQPALFSLLKSSDILFVNRLEAQRLLKTKIEDPRALVAGLHSLGPSLVIMTDGEKGAYAFDGKSTCFAPAFPAIRVESTGAGDGFASGVLGAIMYEKSLSEALAWGAVNAASVISKIGPTAGLLTHTEIMNRLRRKPMYKTNVL